ncbi:MAG: transglycosylase SLT domain-containing protein [Burkholderia sp.]|nr:transglycosylase SLT domain-containing protein [Burkholderia sp.]
MRLLIGILFIQILTACASQRQFNGIYENSSQKVESNFLTESSYINENEIVDADKKFTDSLWSRIRQGFQIPDLHNNIVDVQVLWYINRPNYIKRMIDRSKKYIYHIVDGLEARHMPSELALLPFIESAYDPQALSVAKAAGIWQFVPETGRIYNLRQNMWQDDRRDILASTNAALDYLSRLHNIFGDWYLALAAYNWGEGNVRRAIAQNQASGLPACYKYLRMPNETKNYIPKLQAVKNLITNPKKYKIVLPDIPNHPYFSKVSTFRDIDMSIVAKLANLPIDELRLLNPSFKTPVILHAAKPKILLPFDRVAVFIKNIKGYKGRLSLWTTYTVKRRARPRELAHNLGIDVNTLISVNRIPVGMRLKPGSTLIVPRKKDDSDISMTIAESGRLKIEPDVSRVYKTHMRNILRTRTLRTRTRKILIRIHSKQTIKAIANKYSVSEKKLRIWNHIRHKILMPGQMIALYIPARQSVIINHQIANKKLLLHRSSKLVYHSRKVVHANVKKNIKLIANNKKTSKKFITPRIKAKSIKVAKNSKKK